MPQTDDSFFTKNTWMAIARTPEEEKKNAPEEGKKMLHKFTY